MYSKNDYRYYLENQLMHSDDYFAHYGVKGMKWKNHKKSSIYDSSLLGKDYTYKIGNKEFETHQPGQLEKAYHKHELRSKSNQIINKTNQYKWKDNRSVQKNIEKNLDTAKRRYKLKKASYKAIDKAYGPVDLTGGKGGTHETKTVSFNKKKRKPLTKDSFKRTKPKGKKLKGSNNIYVSHETTLK